VKLSEKRNFDLESDEIADRQVILQVKAKDVVEITEIIILGQASGSVAHHLGELGKAGLVEHEK